MAKGKKFRAAKVKNVKKVLAAKDPRLKSTQDKLAKKEAKRREAAQARNVEQVPTSMFFAHNDALGPPFHVLIDTNFINFSIKNKIDVVKGMTDCLLAKCIPVVLDSVMAELEKLGSKYRVALRLAKDPRFMRMASYLKKGTYADDDIFEHARVHQGHPPHLVADGEQVPSVPRRAKLHREHRRHPHAVLGARAHGADAEA